MNIKSVQWYTIQTPIDYSADELDNILSKRRIRSVPSNEPETTGWVSPFGESSQVLCHSANGYYLMTAQKETRLLPSAILNDAVTTKVNEILQLEGRTVGRQEKKRIKEELQFTMLPKAFIKKTQTNIYIDITKQILAICCSSKSQADQITSLLRNTLGTLNITPIKTDIDPGAMMSQWLLQNKLPGQLHFGQDCEMTDKEQGSIKFNKQDIISHNVLSHLKEGKSLTKLGLCWQDAVTFCFNKDLSLSKIKWLNLDIDNETGPMDNNSEAHKIDVAFILMTGILTQIMSDILSYTQQSEKALA